jgi:carbamoyl-phosphate synthase large subunit
MKETNVLLISAGRRVELVEAFKQAYQLLKVKGEVICADCNPLAPALYRADRSYVVPRLNHPDFQSTILRICDHHAISAVFPLIDPDIAVLSAMRPDLEKRGTVPAAVDAAGLKVVRDKFHTADFFRRLGLRTPESWLPEQLPKQSKFPVFIKPRDGSSSKHIFTVNSQHELDFFQSYVPDPIIQEFVDGPEITIDVLNDMSGRFITSLARKRIEVRGGEVLKGVTVFDQKIHEDCKLIAEALAAPGPITVQCIIQNGEPYYTEINARFGGGSPLGIAAGIHYPAILLSHLTGAPLPKPLAGSYKQGLFVSRFDHAIFIDEEAHAEMASRRI